MASFNKHSTKKIGLTMLAIGWILILGLVWVLYSKVIFAPKASEVTFINGITKIKLSPSHDGHYRIIGNINQTKIYFLIDTGASSVAIPASLAKKLNLPKLGTTAVMTAGGKSDAYFTRIDKLWLGNILISDVRAVVVNKMTGNTALLGMNVLKKFRIEQNKDYMVLTIRQ